MARVPSNRRPVGKTTAQAGRRPPNQLRIVGGRWRGMRIDFPDVEAIRPSPDRVRETLFNWLQTHISGARCLDLFAGSGALGIEALSRGASAVTFVDREPQVGRHLTQTLQRLGATGATVKSEDAIRFLERTPQPFDLVFLDPPFASTLLQPVFARLPQGWLAPEAHIYVECPSNVPMPPLSAGWSVYRSKQAGQVGYHLLRVTTARIRSAEEVLP
ncbi:ribosomal RNA small subunit methyltransferase D [Steroidobacter agaridevorans]|uniref:Ribosomal RNA small subunit methyltransferase D n=1 Tax=Steroidobacter agaridevorans TaxID=2695856 RepID=A0A829YC82_9GAMM|nr:16S rRNA (guanine(966)-N(2))-methyltransferase RsmD [Steroidobacter agaridevorans]GFE80877.1 ribosomal RNA small subunit methyltransferase D [Steroidobacter agaridevorans]GFE89239.1 ribosomal RNA small subunit methyltransferase D [Steroidobacter agaridevorans]